MKTLHILVSGIVQGVGFRYFAYKTALRLNIKGWVRNLPDGRVEIMAQGNESALREFVKQLRIGPRFATVKSVRVEEKLDEPEYDQFDITY